MSGGQGRVRLGSCHPQATDPKVGQGPRQVVDGAEQEMLDGPGRRLDRRWAERRLSVGRKDDAVDASGFGAAKERAHVLGILQRVQDEDERRLGALDAASQDLVERGEPPRSDDEGNALVSIEAGDRRQRSTFHLDDRDPEARRVENEPFEGLAALGDDEQADGRATRHERLLDWPAPGDELLALIEQADRRWRRRPPILACPRPGLGALAAVEGLARSIEWSARLAIEGWAGTIELWAGTIERPCRLVGRLLVATIEWSVWPIRAVRRLVSIAERWARPTRLFGRATIVGWTASRWTEPPPGRSARASVEGAASVGAGRPIVTSLRATAGRPTARRATPLAVVTRIPSARRGAAAIRPLTRSRAGVVATERWRSARAGAGSA